jgi:TPR repeat protein
VRACGAILVLLLAGCPGPNAEPPPPPTVKEVAQHGCDVGDGESCAILAELYEHARGGEARDRRKAANTYMRACYFKSARSCRFIADWFHRRVEVPETPKDAAILFEQACQWGDAASCHALSVMLATGDGADKDEGRAGTMRDRALLLLRTDCTQGALDSCDELAEMYAHGEGVAQDEQRATDMRRVACKAGSASACLHGGDTASAVAVLDSECSGGDNMACSRLSSIHPDEAMKATPRQKACDAGFAGDCVDLAATLDDPERKKILVDRAAELWGKECQEHYADACEALSKLKPQ